MTLPNHALQDVFAKTSYNNANLLIKRKRDEIFVEFKLNLFSNCRKFTKPKPHL